MFPQISCYRYISIKNKIINKYYVITAQTNNTIEITKVRIRKKVIDPYCKMINTGKLAGRTLFITGLI